MKTEIYLAKERCKGCGICIALCQAQVLVRSEKANPQGIFLPEVKNLKDCLNCGMCEMLCPDFALWVAPVQIQKAGT